MSCLPRATAAAAARLLMATLLVELAVLRRARASVQRRPCAHRAAPPQTYIIITNLLLLQAVLRASIAAPHLVARLTLRGTCSGERPATHTPCSAPACTSARATCLVRAKRGGATARPRAAAGA